MILNDWYQVIVSTESFANLIKCAILSWNKVRTIIYETMKIKWKNLKHTVTNNEKNKETFVQKKHNDDEIFFCLQ